MDPRLRFGGFELDPRTEELRQDGRPVHLPPQPARVLALLASRPGEIVLRDDIRRHIWGDSFVDADAGLNVCIRQIRAALGDHAEAPAYVETVPRKGYRFVATVESAARPPRRRARRWLAAAGISALVLGAIGLHGVTAQRSGTALTSPERVKLPADPAAREAYLEGRYLLDQMDYTRLAESAERFRQAIARSPGHPAPHVGLGEALLRLGGPPHERMPAARNAFLRALELDPELPGAHLGLATVRLYYDWDLPAAGASLDRAAALGLESAELHEAFALSRAFEGRPDEAFEHLEKALVFDPVSARIQGEIGWFYEMLGDHATALEQCRKTLRLEPDHVPTLLCLLVTQRALGDEEQAIAAARRLMELHDAPPERMARLTGDGLAVFDEWQLDRILARQASQYVSPCQIGLVYAKLGDAAQAFAHLEAGFEQRSGFMLFLETEPALEPLRSHPRYAALVEKVRAEIRG
ncbi:MAG TPA: winged helix-turn-helix domain-containing protein [Thermoanaerobaculia bacterium]